MITLGIDCGTQSTKTVALDVESGTILASAQQAYDLIPGLPPGAAEQHPGDWVRALSYTIREVVRDLGSRASEIRGIGVSGQQHGLVVLDEKGDVVRPAKLWCDTSTQAECQAIEAEIGGADRVLEIAGNRILPGYTAPKIRWLQDREPDNWAKTQSVLLPHDYLNFYLTGRKAMEYGDASGTALLDVRKREWSTPLIEATAKGLEPKLPPLVSSNEPMGVVSERVAEELGLPSDVVVSAGGGDNMMGAIGTGNISEGIVTASLGTSGTLYAYSKSPIVDPRGEIAAFCDSTDAWLPLLCTMNVTLVTELTRNLFGWSHADFDREVAAVPPGADGLVLLPYLNGERTPNLPQSTGVLLGLTTRNYRPPHLARAAMEGVTLGLGFGLRRLAELGMQPTEVRLTGGGSNSAAWRHICADIFGMPVVCLQTAEGAGLGAAIQAGAQAGLASLAELARRAVQPDESTRTLPRAETAETYVAAAERADSLRQALINVGML